MNTDEVRLSFDDLLLPWAQVHDKECAQIIEHVIAKAAAYDRAHSNSVTSPRIPPALEGSDPQSMNDSSRDTVTQSTHPVRPMQPVTAHQVTDGRSARRKYASPAERQAAYRARKVQAV